MIRITMMRSAWNQVLNDEGRIRVYNTIGTTDFGKPSQIISESAVFPMELQELTPRQAQEAHGDYSALIRLPHTAVLSQYDHVLVTLRKGELCNMNFKVVHPPLKLAGGVIAKVLLEQGTE